MHPIVGARYGVLLTAFFAVAACSPDDHSCTDAGGCPDAAADDGSGDVGPPVVTDAAGADARNDGPGGLPTDALRADLVTASGGSDAADAPAHADAADANNTTDVEQPTKLDGGPFDGRCTVTPPPCGRCAGNARMVGFRLASYFVRGLRKGRAE